LNTDIAMNEPVTELFSCNEAAYAAGPLDDQDSVKTCLGLIWICREKLLPSAGQRWVQENRALLHWPAEAGRTARETEAIITDEGLILLKGALIGGK
jgi:hypothetical protein